MVAEGEKYKEQDELNKKRIESKNSFENTIYSMKNTINDEKMKMEDSDKEQINEFLYFSLNFWDP